MPVIATSRGESRMKLSIMVALAIVLAARPAIYAADRGAGAVEWTITGTVEDALGGPLAGAKLELQSSVRKTVARSPSLSAGKFIFRQVVPGTCANVARRTGL